MGRPKHKAPSADMDDGVVEKKRKKVRHKKEKPEKKKKVRKKKIRVSKYMVDVENLVSKDLRIKQSCDSEQFPVDLNGEYITCSRAELVNMVYEKIREAYKIAKRSERKPDYHALISDVLNKMGCGDLWSRGKIWSELSKRIQARRKVKREAEKRREIEEARQAELSLGVSEND
ncbi:MAG: hypothetical protein HZB09_02545 [Candidatus Yonathbacteria bacterium]|nr:hypothetical protein [Candidatus Yonathbacteria bacterium]